MSNEDNCTSEDENILKEEEVTCCCTRGLNPLFYYKENDKQYDLQPFTHYFDGKYLYISRGIANRYYRYDLEEARRIPLRIPLRMSNGNIVLARADLLTADEQYFTQTKEVAQQPNHETQQPNQPLETAQQQQGCGCKTVTITTALALLSTILIAVVLRRN